MVVPLLKTNLQSDFPLVYRGKVRDVYDVGDERLLLVATDRISAFDVVMANGVPDKGRLLTAVSAFWFEWIEQHFENEGVRTHYISADWEKITQQVPELAPFFFQLAGRSMLVHKMERMIPVEGVVRGRLYGSGWRDYQRSGETSGVKLPAGLRQADKLPRPIFTPATKAVEGHDENLPLAEMFARGLVDEEEAFAIEGLSLNIFEKASAYAESLGIIIADTKLEFGDDGAGAVLCDEVFTSDSSRVWPLDQWQPGQHQEDWCLDKEYVRRYLESLVAADLWDKDPNKPGPTLPAEVVAECQQRYQRYHDLLYAPLVA